MAGFFDDNPRQSRLDPAYSGSRAHALKNGEIIDVSQTARQSGFRWPTALTRAVWEDCVAWTEEDSKRQTPQTESVRMRALVSKCTDTVRLRTPSSDRMAFSINRIPRDGKAKTARSVILQLVAHPGDDEEPVLTIRLLAK